MLERDDLQEMQELHIILEELDRGSYKDSDSTTKDVLYKTSSSSTISSNDDDNVGRNLRKCATIFK